MALFKAGPLASEIRGSIGGTVFARNKGGLYMRARTVGINPQSVRQVAVRSVFGDLAQAWSNVLTDAQRAAWELYAANVPLINALGEPRNVSGQNMFIRSNALLIDTAQTQVNDAPTNFTVGPTLTPTFSLDAAADTFDITDLGAYSPDSAGINVLVAMGTPQNGGVNFFKSPFRKAYGANIDDTTNPVPIADIAASFPFEAGQAVFLRTANVTPDGRVGVPTVQRFLVT